MKHINRMASHLAGFSSGASLGGKVSHYQVKENIYTEGTPADTISTFKKERCDSPPERTVNVRQLP